jgi:hypothetical protein
MTYSLPGSHGGALPRYVAMEKNKPNLPAVMH